MENEEFKEPKPGALKQKLEGHEEPFDPAAWNKINERLRKKKRRGGFFWLFLGIGLLAGGMAYFALLKSDRIQVPNSGIVQDRPAVQEPGHSTATKPESSANSTSGNLSASSPESSSSIPNPVNKSTSEEKPVQSPSRQSENGEQRSKPGSITSTRKPDEVASVVPASDEVVEVDPDGEEQVKDFGSKRKSKKRNRQRPTSRKPTVQAPELANTLPSESRTKPVGRENATSAGKNQKKVRSEVASGIKGNQKNVSTPDEDVETAGRETHSGATAGPDMKPVVPGKDKEVQPSAQALAHTTNDQKPTTPSSTVPTTPNPANPEKENTTVPNNTQTPNPDSTGAKANAIAPVDSLPLVAPKDSAKPEKQQRRNFWFAGLSAGSMVQSAVLKASNTNRYTNDNAESIAILKSSDVQRPVVLNAQFGRLWQLVKGLHFGAGIQLTGIYQKLTANLNSGRFSASRFEYSNDSLTLRAFSLAELGTKSYERFSYSGDVDLRLQWKPVRSRFGLAVQWVLVRYMGNTDSKGYTDDGFSKIPMLPDLRIFYSIGHRNTVYLQTLSLQWNNAALPVPVASSGNATLISVGFGRTW